MHLTNASVPSWKYIANYDGMTSCGLFGLNFLEWNGRRQG